MSTSTAATWQQTFMAGDQGIILAAEAPDGPSVSLSVDLVNRSPALPAVGLSIAVPVVTSARLSGEVVLRQAGLKQSLKPSLGQFWVLGRGPREPTDATFARELISRDPSHVTQYEFFFGIPAGAPAIFELALPAVSFPTLHFPGATVAVTRVSERGGLLLRTKHGDET